MEALFVWLARLMFVGVFLLAGGMLYRAGRIAIGRDMRFVADWRGRTLAEPARWARWVLPINLIGGMLLLAVGVAVLLVGLAFTVWTGAAGLILWSYYFLLKVVDGRASRAAPRAPKA
jgi:hypothetical protein